MAGIAFALSTTLVAMLEFHNILFPVAWGPLIMFLGCRLLDADLLEPTERTGFESVFWRCWPTAFCSALALALCYLAGNPQYVLFPVIAVFSYGACRAIMLGERRRATRALALFGGSGLLALMLCAPQILPFIELLKHSIRSGEIDAGIAGASVHPFHALTMLFPLAAGTPGGEGAYWGRSVFQFWLGTMYVGIVPLIGFPMVFSGLFPESPDPQVQERRCRVVFCLCAIAAGAALAAGSYLPFYGWGHRWLPGFDRVRWPSRFLLWVTTFVPLLGAMGLECLCRDREQGKRPARLFWGTIVGATAALLLAGATAIVPTFGMAILGLYAGAARVASERVDLLQADCGRVAIVLALATGAILVLSRVQRPRVRLAAMAALVTLAGIDLLLVGRPLQPLSGVDIYQYEPPSLGELKTHVSSDGPGRVLSIYGPNQYHLYGVSDPAVYRLARAVGVGDTLGQSDIESAWRSSLSLSRYSYIHDMLPTADDRTVMRLLRALNVRGVITGPPWAELIASPSQPLWQIVEIPDALPRALLVSTWRTVDSFKDGLSLLSGGDIDLSREALLEPLPGTTLPPASGGASPGNVKSIDYSVNGVVIRAHAERACLLVLNDTWFPGWQATVNGVPEPVIRANLLFRAIALPPGDCDVVFRYSPRPWRVGIAFFAVACGLMAALTVMSVQRTRAVRSPQDGHASPP
ncbi:MAG: hypothetical protein HN742_01675 [Lentisphaerae bacterium]|nr:hypothetical protein [Lentisphaerota bacterium]MBT4814933.1 hypothetical protein [Lentisphaerota bacterium]MBT5611089.1 hypothetical protein [Lentisphaerota bacterium]MBT7061844.1 hypothetical protein [Lentisphaerota bacterium]MBT7840545.1 hypothetical protein [Lentisphaerota bacterium]